MQSAEQFIIVQCLPDTVMRWIVYYSDIIYCLLYINAL